MTRVARFWFVVYGQNPDKKWPKLLFFEKVMAEITICFNYNNFHIHRCLKLVERQYIFCRKKCDFAKEASFCPKTAISAINLRLPVFNYLNKT